MKTTSRCKSLWVLLGALCLTLACAQPDSVLTARVKASMAVDTTVKAAQIEVTTQDHVVTLKGNIDSQAEKDRALEIARGTGGVVDVVDLISVRTASEEGNAPEPSRTLGEHIDDAVITAAVKTRLLEDPLVQGSRIDVDTREGIVFLTGNVHSAEEKERAIAVARATNHVKDVKPNLTISRG